MIGRIAELDQRLGAQIGLLGEEYRKLGDRRFAGGGGPHSVGPEDVKGEANAYEQALRDAGLLDGAATHRALC